MNSTAKITRSMKEVDVDRQWYIVDAAGQTLGRLASQVAFILRGKHRPYFTPHVDCGDFVIVINADKIKVTGKREEMKEYFHYTGYPGGGRFRPFKSLKTENPEFVISHAVKGMLPKNILGKKIAKKLKVYGGSEHPHEAQKPVAFTLPYAK